MKRLFLSSLLALAFLSAPAFSAEVICMQRPVFLKAAKEMGKAPIVRTMAQNSKGHPLMFEWWIDKENTVVETSTQANGTLCIIWTGIGFEIVKDTDKGI